MMPIVDGLEAEYAGQLTVLRLDANERENAELMQAYKLRGHPSFALLAENGRLTQTYFGPQTEDTLRAAIQAILPPS